MTRPISKRYDFAPLEAQTTMALRDDAVGTVNAIRIGERLGTSRWQVYRWRSEGMTLIAAEAAAEAAGFLPFELWPSMLDNAIADLERVCEAADCPVVFVTKYRGTHRKFCSDTCRSRKWSQVYRERPAVRQRSRDYQRTYNAEVREAKARREARKAA